MDEWGQQERLRAERILGQTATLFAQRGDDDAGQLLRAVRCLEFEQTSDSFTDATNWHDYYWAAVFFVDERHAPRFTDTALRNLLPVLAEVARQNGTDHVDRIHLKPHLPDWRDTPTSATAPEHAHRGRDKLAGDGAAQEPARITEVTRHRLFDALRAAGTLWSGGLDEVTFLRRLYDLDALESTDSRFATAEGDIVQHRYNNPEDWEDDWVFTDPRFQLADGPDEMVLRFLAEMIHPAVRSDDEEVERLLALFNNALGRDGYRLAPATTISGYPVYEARHLAGRSHAARPASPAASPDDSGPAPARNGPTHAPESPGGAGYGGPDTVRSWARGERKDYNCPRQPLPDGGQADVFRAVHKPTGTVVALKKLHQRHPPERQVARMRREIEIGRRLDGHPHVMPVLDFGADHTWFVMPWADATAEMQRTLLQEPGQLRGLVDALAAVLSQAHALGWLHRDIKPSNILYLDGRWTLADWGIVRRPRGQTTKVGRTGPYLGTEGFAAPELSEDPHGATYASDIYSIGRVIAWALTGEMPRANATLLPPQPGPWRTIARATTHQDAGRRPQNIADLLALIEREHAVTPQDPLEHATKLVAAASEGTNAAVGAFLALLTDHFQDYELHVGLLPQLDPNRVGSAFTRDLPQARTILRALAEFVDGDDTHMVQFGEAATVVTWLHAVAAFAADRGHWDVLEEAAQAMCVWDGAWDQWRAQDKIRPWLGSLRDDAAAAVAAVLREHPDSAAHFGGLAKNRMADSRIRQAVGEA